MTTQRQTGFSMIELMLALALGLVVTWGIVQLFVGNSRTYTAINGQSRLQENARYALDFIARSARSSGYFGCAPNVFSDTLNGSADQLFEFNIERAVEAFNYGGDGTSVDLGDWAPSVAALPRQAGGVTLNAFVDGNGIDISTVQPGTDIVAFRRVEAPELIAGDVGPLDEPVVEDDGDVDFEADDFLAISDCKYATVFRVTDVVADGGNWRLERAPGTGIFGNKTDLSLGNHFGDVIGLQGTTVGRVVTDIFFIGPGTGTNNRGQQTMALWRRSGVNAPVELVEGVEDLQVLFGIDTDPTDASDAPNVYSSLDAVDLDTDEVRTMRVEVTVNTVDVIEPGQAAPARRTFSQTINMRNAG